MLGGTTVTQQPVTITPIASTVTLQPTTVTQAPVTVTQELSTFTQPPTTVIQVSTVTATECNATPSLLNADFEDLLELEWDKSSFICGGENYSATTSATYFYTGSHSAYVLLHTSHSLT